MLCNSLRKVFIAIYSIASFYGCDHQSPELDCNQELMADRLILGEGQREWINGDIESDTIQDTYKNLFPYMAKTIEDLNRTESYCGQTIIDFSRQNIKLSCSVSHGLCTDGAEPFAPGNTLCDEVIFDEVNQTIEGIDLFYHYENDRLDNVKICGHDAFGTKMQFTFEPLGDAIFWFWALGPI